MLQTAFHHQAIAQRTQVSANFCNLTWLLETTNSIKKPCWMCNFGFAPRYCDLHIWPVTRNRKRSNCFFPAVSSGSEHNSCCFHTGFSPFCPKTQAQTELQQFLWAKENHAVSTQTCRSVFVQGHLYLKQISLPGQAFVLLGEDIIHCSWKIKRILNFMDCNTQANFLLEAQTDIQVNCLFHFLNIKCLKVNNAFPRSRNFLRITVT